MTDISIETVFWGTVALGITMLVVVWIYGMYESLGGGYHILIRFDLPNYMEFVFYLMLRPRDWKIAVGRIYYDWWHYYLWLGPLGFNILPKESE